MPRLDLQHRALMGVGLSTVSLDKVVIDTMSGGARWHGDSFIYQRTRVVNGSEINTIRRVDGATNWEISDKGANELFASRNNAYGFLPASGVRNLSSSAVYPGYGKGDGSLLNNHVLVVKDYQSGNGLVDLETGVEYNINNITSVRAYEDYFVVLQGSSLTLFNYDGSPITGTKHLNPVNRPGTSSCRVGQSIMLLYNSGKYLVLHAHDSLIGRVITDNDSAFNPDIVDNGSLMLAYSLGAGEAPDELVKLTEAQILAIPMQDLTKLGQVNPPIPIPPVSELKKPEVTVLTWTLDELKNGREFNFIDRENEGFGARVWIENGSMFASFTNPKGIGRTGAARLVKACPQIPPPIEPPVPPIDPPGPINPPAPSISKVRVEGLVFKNEDNSIFPYRGATSFLLLRRLLEGDGAGVHSVCSEFNLLGRNVLRVFSQVDWIGPPTTPGPGFYPADYPNYDVKVAELFDIAKLYNLHIELVAHTFAYDMDSMVAHVNRLHNIIKSKMNVFLELANEPPRNGIDIQTLMDKLDLNQFTYPWSSGQYDPTCLPAGSYCTPHTPRDSEWPRKAKNLLEYRNGGGPEAPTDPAMQRPIVGDEPIGAGEVDDPGRRSTNALDFYTYAALAQLYGTGSTFHYELGLNAIFPPKTSIQYVCAEAFAQGSKAVSPTVQLWNYTRVGLGGCPIKSDNSLRTYGMQSGAVAVFVRVRPTGPYELEQGWKVTSSDQFGIVLTLLQE